jgi:LmbE family N-acetylglucosaminyl deacetylase
MIELPKDSRVLVFCAHPDDDTFGMGAAILGMVKNGCRVICAYVTTSPRGVMGNGNEDEKKEVRMNEARKACDVLGAEAAFLDFHKTELDKPVTLERLKGFIARVSPKEIFTLPPDDLHPTHRKVSVLSRKAAAEAGFRKTWTYETWTLIRQPNFYHYFGEKDLKVKMRAMGKHASQLKRQGPTDEAFACLNRFRAIMSREPEKGFALKHDLPGKYAEAFLVDRIG